MGCVVKQTDTWNYSQRQKNSLPRNPKLQKAQRYTNESYLIFHSYNDRHTHECTDRHSGFFSHLPCGSSAASHTCPRNDTSAGCRQVRAHSAELPGTDGCRCLGEGSFSAGWRGRERRLQKVTQLWMWHWITLWMSHSEGRDPPPTPGC